MTGNTATRELDRRISPRYIAAVCGLALAASSLFAFALAATGDASSSATSTAAPVPPSRISNAPVESTTETLVIIVSSQEQANQVLTGRLHEYTEAFQQGRSSAQIPRVLIADTPEANASTNLMIQYANGLMQSTGVFNSRFVDLR